VSGKLDIEVGEIREATCLACGHHVAATFLAREVQPLATLGWPTNQEAAQTMVRLPVEFVRCVDCGHVFNAAFDYAQVPYAKKPNIMFNRGALWGEFIRDTQRALLARLPTDLVAVEIGHGDGSFLAALADLRPEGRFVGFDPQGTAEPHDRIAFRAGLFDPLTHLPELRPDLIISRHVFEHLSNPLGFLQRLSFASAAHGLAPRAYFEVPCVDRAIETRRTVDFYYEHSSQFTTASFKRMLERCAADVEEIGYGYDGEVLFGFVRLAGVPDQIAGAQTTWLYREAAERSLEVIATQLTAIHSAGQRVAIWGGTGKSAAFINRYGVDMVRFPVVVDSDVDKVGTFVPGTGQEIRFRDWLKDHPIDVVIIPPQWRARDVVSEIRQHAIQFKTILIEHGGRLIDYLEDKHPYARP
jgi:hypothetical protein